jgi:hypothetical protein
MSVFSDEQRKEIIDYIDSDIPDNNSDQGTDNESGEEDGDGRGPGDDEAVQGVKEEEEGDGGDSEEDGQSEEGTEVSEEEGDVEEELRKQALAESDRIRAEEEIYERVRLRKESGNSEKQEESKKGILENFPKFDPDVHDPEIISAFNALKEHIANQEERIEQLTEVGRSVESSATAAATREVETWFDHSVAGLGEEFKEILGEGGYSTLKLGSSQRAKRDAIAENITVMMAGYNAVGKQPPSRDKIFEIAAGNVLAGDFAKIQERKTQKSVNERRSQHVNRVGSNKQKQKLDPFDEVAEIIGKKHFGK